MQGDNDRAWAPLSEPYRPLNSVEVEIKELWKHSLGFWCVHVYLCVCVYMCVYIYVCVLAWLKEGGKTTGTCITPSLKLGGEQNPQEGRTS